MERVVVALLLISGAVIVAAVLARRAPDAPTRGNWMVPAQLDRNDFIATETPWLVVVFTSATCETCAAVAAAASRLSGPGVAVQEVEVGVASALHERYGIDAVPTLVMADADGVVRASHVGPLDDVDLGEVLARLRGGS
ncbi:MAG: thioredoxin family protein [Acidimicrobiales bacterium]|nr:thioredoxin family protein [Acidimicrobiales bacterium]